MTSAVGDQQLRHPESLVVIRSSVMAPVKPNWQGTCTPPDLQAPRNRTGGERIAQPRATLRSLWAGLVLTFCINLVLTFCINSTRA
jgi:hypothetical protein